MSQQEAENLQDPYIVQHTQNFTEYEIDGEEPDAIIFDTDSYGHKAIWYTKPKMLENQATLKYSKGEKVDTGQGEVRMHVDIYQHQTIITENKIPLMIRIGQKENILLQMEEITKSAGYALDQQNFLKFCPNVEKLKQQHPEIIPAIPIPSQ
jgi:hypothetical protein